MVPTPSRSNASSIPPGGGNWDHAGPRERTPSVPASEARMAKKATRRRYTSTEKKRILSIAQKEGLTGADVQKRFGIAQLTFYRWRGPVRGPKARAAQAAGGLTRAAAVVGRTAGRAAANLDAIREEVRSGVRAVIPNVIREEVTNYLSEILGRRGPGRPKGSGRGPGRPRGTGPRKAAGAKTAGRRPGRPAKKK